MFRTIVQYLIGIRLVVFLFGFAVALFLHGCGSSTPAPTPAPPRPSPRPTTLAPTPSPPLAFNCAALKQDHGEPQTIADLQPSHVTIVMAMGDSITAGFSAENDLDEARNISWSIGKGSERSVTLPWLLERFSPKVEGQSTGKRTPDLFSLPVGDYHPATDQLNVAEASASVSKDSLNEQWAYLMAGMKNFSDFDSRWKILTVWMTANDVCEECSQPIEKTARYKRWVGGFEKLLENAEASLNKTYINLVSTMHMSKLAEIQRKDKHGCAMKSKLFKECTCINDHLGNATALKLLDRNIDAMNRRLHKFASDWQTKLKNKNRTDIAIVVQPFLEGFGEAMDAKFVSTVDCFHPSAPSHQALAIGLWNSMLCTGDRKSHCGKPFSHDVTVTCPTEASKFYTGPDVEPQPTSDATWFA